jgi:hypothetical protein
MPVNCGSVTPTGVALHLYKYEGFDNYVFEMGLRYHCSTQVGSGARLVSYPTGTGAFPRSVKQTKCDAEHTKAVPGLRIRGNVTVFPCISSLYGPPTFKAAGV